MSRSTIYIAGPARSGSTVLGIVLGSLPQVNYCGEWLHIYRDLAQNRLCSCGSHASACTFWRQIRSHLGKSNHQLMVAQRAVNRQRHRLWAASRTVDALSELHRAIGLTTGASVLVDSSKTTSLIDVHQAVAPTTVLWSQRPWGQIWHSLRPASREEQVGMPPIRRGVYLAKSGFSRVIASYAGAQTVHTDDPDCLSQLTGLLPVDVAPALQQVAKRKPFRAQHVMTSNRVRTRPFVFGQP